MSYNTLITKEYINDNIRPFSGNDSLYEATVRESILHDLGFPSKLTTELLVDNVPDDMSENMLEPLRLTIGYFAYSRAILTGQLTITKYGVTTKTNDNSYPADSELVHSNATYFKNLGEKMLQTIKCQYKDYLKTYDVPINMELHNERLHCQIIGD